MIWKKFTETRPTGEERRNIERDGLTVPVSAEYLVVCADQKIHVAKFDSRTSQFISPVSRSTIEGVVYWSESELPPLSPGMQEYR